MPAQPWRLPDGSPTLIDYGQLPRIDEIGARHAWDYFGRDDVLGRINLLTPEVALAGSRSILTGELINLSLPLNLPDPPLTGFRRQYRQTVHELGRNVLDDHLDEFYLQASTQWDGLRHFRAREFGFYGGRTGDPGGSAHALGISHWAEHGLAGRGVLIDVAAHFAATGRSLDPRLPVAITVADLVATLEWERVELRVGDLIMIRTGWVDVYLATSPAHRAAFGAAEEGCAGLHPGEAMAEFLWNCGVVAVAADNPTLEVSPGVPEHGSLHRRLIPLLGFALGELFDLRQLSAACLEDRRFTFMLVASPLNLPGGVGSPANALAIR